MTIVKRIADAALGALLLGTSPIASPAQAGYVVTLQEVGSDVVATGSGPIDLTGLSFVATSPILPNYAYMFPAVSEMGIGPTGTPTFDIYSGISGPMSFGDAGETDISYGTGDPVSISGPTSGSTGYLGVPQNYAGSTLSDTSTYTDKSFITLGVTPGTYIWSWGTEPNQNVTLIISASPGPGPIPIPIPVPVPEPASAALLGMALAGLLLTGTIRRTRLGD